MLNSIRTRLSKFRKKSGPLASLADFGLWVLRNALPLTRPKTWLVAGLFAAGIAGAVLLPTVRGAFAAATAILAGLVTVMLMLSYIRTMMSVHAAELGQSQDRMSEKFARGQAALGAASNAAGTSGAAAIGRQAAETAFEQLLESELMDALVADLDRLRLRVDGMERDADRTHEVAALKAEVNSLARRTDWRLRTDAEAIMRLSGHLAHTPGADGRRRLERSAEIEERGAS